MWDPFWVAPDWRSWKTPFALFTVTMVQQWSKSASSYFPFRCRSGGHGVLPPHGRQTCVPDPALQGQLPWVPGLADANRPAHHHFLRYLRVCGRHHDKLLPGLHCPLLPALEQRNEGGWGGKWGVRFHLKGPKDWGNRKDAVGFAVFFAHVNS